MAGWLGQLVCVLVCLQAVLCQRACEKRTCRECIMDRNLCMWCASEDFEGDRRCQPVTLKNKNWCRSGDIQNPLTNITVTKSIDFNSAVGNVVQIKPQLYHLDLRVGQKQTFSFSYKAAENFPVDIYFLLDASSSMESVREDLTKQSWNIFRTMKGLTENVYMGLGTFIDKNLVPFHYNIIANETYSFKHQLDLTGNITKFKEIVQNFEFGTNTDNPESGLEGIAQVIACKDKIKWREQSRKIIVYMTDAGYHSAGDGKAAGIIDPYDGGCHLDDTGRYTKETEMDYPSVGIINKMATKEQIKILFLSQDVEETVYGKLTKAVSESVHKNFNGAAITKLLKAIYEGITQTIKLKNNMTAIENTHLDIAFEPNCGEFGDKQACTVSVGEEKNFTGTILLKEYFNKDRFSISIKPSGLNEEIALEVNVISNCDCSRNAEINSGKCNKAGNWSCGVCECLDAKFGPTCSCSDTRNSSNCSPRGTEQVCSDHGVCHCGACECTKGYVGEYCQDQNNNCQRDSSGSLCSGRGSCFNGKCTCNSGWKGSACDCTKSNKACIRDGILCNNRGICECGFCECSTLPQWDARFYQDNFCTPCADCHSRQCRHLIPCVNCLHDGGMCEDICGLTLIHLQNVSVVAEELNSKWNVCSNIRVGFGCYSDFKYIYNDNDTMTLLVFDRNCSQSQIVFGVISLVVLVAVGLATLIAWKLLTDARDRREYELFLKASESGDSEHVNPTYAAPSTTYLNPAFQNHAADT